jgi:hypothetical protein
MNIPSHKEVTKALGQIGLGVGIIISLTIAIQFTTSSVFPDTDRGDYCPNYRDLQEATDENACMAIGGVWHEATDGEPVYFAPGTAESSVVLEDLRIQTMPIATKSSCGEDYNCQELFEDARQANRTRQFVMSFGLSFVAFVVGMFVVAGTAGTALVWTGVVSMLASLRYIPADKDILVAIATAAVAFVLLVVLAKKQKK